MGLQLELSNYTHGWERPRYFIPLVRPGCRIFFQGLLLSLLEFRLALVRGLGGTGSGLDSGLLDEISPAGMAVFGRLRGFVILGRGFCGVLAPGDLNHATGFVGPNVVPDYGVSR